MRKGRRWKKSNVSIQNVTIESFVVRKNLNLKFVVLLEEGRRAMERKKCQKIHLKINGLYYFYIEKLLRSNLLYVHEFFWFFSYIFFSISLTFVFQGEEHNFSFTSAFILCLLLTRLCSRYTFNRINGLFMFFPSHPQLDTHIAIRKLYLIIRSHTHTRSDDETCLSDHSQVIFIWL